MITNDLQKRIRNGDREAFRTIYSEHGRGVYLNALKALGNETDAHSVVKQTFLNLHHELLRSGEDIDIAARIRELADNELLLMEILDSKTLTQPTASVASKGQSTPQKQASFEDCATSAKPGAPEPVREAVRRPRREEISFDDDDAPDAKAADPLPPFDRARTYMNADDEASLRMREQERGAQQSRRGRGFGRFLLILFLLILLWVAAGILMDFGLIPYFDLGYGWFNAYIFPLFTLGA
jgi:hypothetical protein